MADRTAEFRALVASLPKPPPGMQVRRGGREGGSEGWDGEGSVGMMLCVCVLADTQGASGSVLLQHVYLPTSN